MHTKYFIEEKVIQNTERFLRDYGMMNPSNEGYVYWGGKKIDKGTLIDTVIAPVCNSSRLRISTNHRANFDVVVNLVNNNKVQVAQVHSHPLDWVDHSYGDNEMAPFKVKGLLSIVVPYYGLHGMLPFENCGIHIYDGQEFIRLTDRQIRQQFKIIYNNQTLIIDLRNV